MATSGVNPDGSERKREDMLARAVYGQAAQENPSTRGSRQESWATATVSCGADKQKDGSMTPKLDQQVKQWATPRSGKTTDENPETWKLRQEKGDVATMPLTAQVKAWATPRAEDSESAGMRHGRGTVDTLTAQTRDAWPTLNLPSGGPNSKSTATHTGGMDLEGRVATQHTGKLNPRWVETLMGIPIGWTMPSCSNPVTIEQTSCACLETESARQRQQKPSSLYYKNSPHTHNHHGIKKSI
jgi:hypothetical protein